MALAGVCSGLVLAGVYQATLPRIRQNRARALENAIFQVLPGATSFVAYVPKGDGLMVYPGNLGELSPGDAIFQGHDETGRSVGVALPGAGPGYMDTIALLCGYQPDTLHIVGLQILESRETPGLGDKIIYDPAFQENFEALATVPEPVLVKEDAKTRPHEVNGISGATISSKAVVTILTETLRHWKPRLESLPE